MVGFAVGSAVANLLFGSSVDGDSGTLGLGVGVTTGSDFGVAEGFSDG